MNPGRFTFSSTDGVNGIKNLNAFVLGFFVLSGLIRVHGSFYAF